MTHLLTPLYAVSLGMSALQIGVLFSLPVVLQVALTLVGGALTDRLGGKKMALGSSALLGLAGLVFLGAAGFAMMFAAQLLMVLSRAIFWPATWSLGSRMPGDAHRQMGLLNSAVNAGQVVGIAAAGFLISNAGFKVTFAIMAGASFCALLVLHFYDLPAWRASKRRSPQTLGSILATYRGLLGKHALHYSILCSYISALPLSLSFSFYPILFLAQGFDVHSAGIVVSFRAIGGIAAGFVVGTWLKHVYGLLTPLACTVGIALAVTLTSAIAQPLVVAALMFGLGMGSAVMMLVFQMVISETSSQETRGSAMALGTVGGTLSNLTTPLLMGAMIDSGGIFFAFQLIALLAMATALALIPLRARAQEEARREARGSRR